VGVIGEGVDLLKLVDEGVNADLYKQLGNGLILIRSETCKERWRS
jgi:hypothetical protein